MKTTWSLNELKRYTGEPLRISDTVDLEKELIERSNEIIEASPIECEGLLIVDDNEEEYILHLEAHVKLTLPSARSLEPVEYDLQVSVSETYLPSDSSYTVDEYDTDDIVIVLEEDILDIRPAITDSILSAIPTQVFTEEELKESKMPSGNEWVVVSEEEHHSSIRKRLVEEGDPRFAALKSLFSEEDETNKDESDSSQ